MNVSVWPHGDPNVIVRRVLAQPVFRAAGASSHTKPPPSLFDLAWSWFVDHVLRPIFPPLARALAASHGIGTVAGVALIVLALAALGFVIVRLALAFVRPAPIFGAESVASRALAARRSPSDWRAVATRAAAQGDYARAISALFSAALAALDAPALVPFEASRTPGEYRRLVSGIKRAAAPPFEDLCERYVRAAYAALPPTVADYAAARRALEAFEPALRA